ncbi:MAG TPA: hypothetical protein VL171_09280 [Verrucomicrobiae bacterium]|nr:hypothetical protein [Verrucomicrobiae bacterium]
MRSPRVTQLVPVEQVERMIHLARGEKVLLDADLAMLGESVRSVESVDRNGYFRTTKVELSPR